MLWLRFQTRNFTYAQTHITSRPGTAICGTHKELLDDTMRGSQLPSIDCAVKPDLTQANTYNSNSNIPIHNLKIQIKDTP